MQTCKFSLIYVIKNFVLFLLIFMIKGFFNVFCIILLQIKMIENEEEKDFNAFVCSQNGIFKGVIFFFKFQFAF